MAQPVLVHANWIDGVDQKVYHLREAGLWAIDEGGVDQERLLTLGDGDADHLSFGAHRRALRDALAIAQALNRTLVLPRLPISRKSSARTRTIAHYFDYGSFVRAFPRVRAHDQSGRALDRVARVHLDMGHGDVMPPGSAYSVVRTASASGNAANGLSDAGLRKHLAPYAHERVLQLWSAYRRFGGRFASAHDKSDFAARAQRGLRPAPRLQNLVQHVHRALRRAARGTFDCVDATADFDFGPLLKASSGERIEAAAPPSRVLRAAARMLNASRVLILADIDAAERRRLRTESEAIFEGRALWMDDFVPPWYTTDFDTPSDRATHARSAVELRLCAKANRFVGSLAAPSTHAVCHLRGAKAAGGGACDDALGRALPARWGLF